MFKSIFLLSLLGLIFTQEIPVKTVYNDGVRSIGFSYIYGDDHMSVVNQVVKEGEKLNEMKSSLNLAEAIPPLPAGDVKCLMSVDRYCSKNMLEIKNVLVQALREDCVKCSKEEKEKAGNVVASMMAHDPAAWKMFLTRYDSVNRVQRILG